MTRLKLRMERMGLQMQKEVSDIIRTQVKDPRIGFLTVTGVEVTNDLAHAKIFISVLGSSEERAQTMQVLERVKGFVRTEIAKRIRMRVTPELHFKLDESMDYSARIGQVLQEIATREEGKDVPRAEEREDGDA